MPANPAIAQEIALDLNIQTDERSQRIGVF
jgi:hypothetical protein